VRLHRTTFPSASRTRRLSTVEAMGGRSVCHPWQLTLREPPTVKELLDCMTATERPVALR
jgi:hypothetical protein